MILSLSIRSLAKPSLRANNCYHIKNACVNFYNDLVTCSISKHKEILSELSFHLFWLIVAYSYLFCYSSEMADMKPGLRKPVFTKVDQLRPGTNGHTLTVKVVDSKMVLQKKRPDGPQVRQMRIAECLVGDETGMILVTARNEQGKPFCSDLWHRTG